MLRVGSNLGLRRISTSRTMSRLFYCVCVCVCVCVLTLDYNLQSFWLKNSAVTVFVIKDFFSQMLFLLLGSRIISPQPSCDTVANSLVMIISLYCRLIKKCSCGQLTQKKRKRERKRTSPPTPTGLPSPLQHTHTHIKFDLGLY